MKKNCLTLGMIFKFSMPGSMISMNGKKTEIRYFVSPVVQCLPGSGLLQSQKRRLVNIYFYDDDENVSHPNHRNQHNHCNHHNHRNHHNHHNHHDEIYLTQFSRTSLIFFTLVNLSPKSTPPLVSNLQNIEFLLGQSIKTIRRGNDNNNNNFNHNCNNNNNRLSPPSCQTYETLNFYL